jgi:hypothetical protein
MIIWIKENGKTFKQAMIGMIAWARKIRTNPERSR